MEELKCPICGDVTSSYMGKTYRADRLCRKHANDFKNGKIERCDKCGEWHASDKSCSCELNKSVFTELPTEGFYKCVACGADTNGSAFCKKCFKKYTDNEMLDMLNRFGVRRDSEKNEIISKSNGIASKESISVDEEKKNVVVIDNNNKARCITCGKQTDGLLFCLSCYHKYKNKELLFRITNCTSVELLDEDYEGRYTCKDGHIVKSMAEREIDNYLFENGIPHAYERELSYGVTEKEVLHPDFFLPNYLGEKKHVYIEHWGYNDNNIQYQKTKKFKMPIYKKLGTTLFCTYGTDMGKIDSVLDRKLKKENIKINEINYEE